MNPWYLLGGTYIVVSAAFVWSLCKAAAYGDQQLEAGHRADLMRRRHGAPRRYCSGRPVGRYQR